MTNQVVAKMNRKALLILSFLIFSLIAVAQQRSISRYESSKSELWAGATIGVSRMLEDAPDSLVQEIQDFYNGLRTGWNYGFEAEFYINRYLGFGAKYSRFITKKEADSIVIQIFTTKYFIDISSEMSIHTFSPIVLGKLPLLHDRLTLTGGIGPAWLFYRNIGKAVGDTNMFKGSSPGLSAMFRVNYQIVPRLSIALEGNYIHAFLKEFTRDNGITEEVIKLDKENYQNISRLEFSFGMFYTFRF